MKSEEFATALISPIILHSSFLVLHLFVVACLDELGGLEVVGTNLHAVQDFGTVASFQLNDQMLQACDIGIAEDSIEANHTALAEFLVVLDVE